MGGLGEHKCQRGETKHHVTAGGNMFEGTIPFSEVQDAMTRQGGLSFR